MQNSGNKEKMAGNPLSIADTMPASIASARFPAASHSLPRTRGRNEESAENEEEYIYDGPFEQRRHIMGRYEQHHESCSIYGRMA
jgi:hypothetical protein